VAFVPERRAVDIAAAVEATSMSLRTCTKCGEAKPHEAFRAEPRTKIGLQAACKVCDQKKNSAWYYANIEVERAKSLVRAKAKYAADPEAAREKQRAYNASHRAECSAKSKRYRDRHREECLERERARYREKKPQQTREEKSAIAEYQKMYRQLHKELLLTNNKVWREENKDRIKATHAAYFRNNRERLIAKIKEWREAHPKLVKEYERKYRHRRVRELRDCYVASLLRKQFASKVPMDATTAPLIDAKRAQVRVLRLIDHKKRRISE
jgi:hypothetical protein